MRLVRSLVTAGGAILAATVFAPASQADESRTLTATKDCTGPNPAAPTNNGIGGYCTITQSNFAPLIGAKVRYYGPATVALTTTVNGYGSDAGDPAMANGNGRYVDSWAVLEAQGGTAFGHCLLLVPASLSQALGHCQFTGGNRSLREFEADVTVTYAGFGNSWNWNGNFSVSGDSD
jgi:hypothetical protein